MSSLGAGQCSDQAHSTADTIPEPRRRVVSTMDFDDDPAANPTTARIVGQGHGVPGPAEELWNHAPRALGVSDDPHPPPSHNLRI
jgi:hypothetical protein